MGLRRRPHQPSTTHQAWAMPPARVKAAPEARKCQCERLGSIEVGALPRGLHRGQSQTRRPIVNIAATTVMNTSSQSREPSLLETLMTVWRWTGS